MKEEISIKSNLNNRKTIKSLYNLKEILNFLDEKKICALVIYNKLLQNVLGINIEDYKTISGKYKIGEKTGKGKEYILNTNILIFEGEYLNGKSHGKGIEYDYDSDFYSNIKKICWRIFKKKLKRKEYNNKDELIFDGEYLEGKKWNGKGKEYNDYGKLIFDGEYSKGKN